MGRPPLCFWRHCAVVQRDSVHGVRGRGRRCLREDIVSDGLAPLHGQGFV